MAESIGDLSVILLWVGAYILATLAYYIAQAVAAPLNIPIPLLGRPFAGIANAIQNAIVGPLNDLRSKSDAEIAKGFSDLVSSLELLIGLTLLLGLGVQKALKYLWGTALSPFIHAITNPIRSTANEALADVTALTKTVADDLTKAENYAETQAANALTSAKSYADKVAGTAKTDAESYADNAVAKLRAAEDTAIANAVDLANAAKAAGLAAVAALSTKLEGEISTAESQAKLEAAGAESAAEAFAASAAASAEAVAATALAQVKAIAVGAESGVTALDDYISSLDLPALIALIPSLAIAIAGLVAIPFIGGKDCQNKVGQICGADVGAWTSLLQGLTLLALAFDFREFVDVAKDLANAVGDIVGELEQPFLGTLPPLTLAA